jgi:ribosomal protein S18 acetylase RimI-like enzyme
MEYMEKRGSVNQLKIREATAEDQTALIALINSAFSVETFLQGTRTNEQRLNAALEDGTILVAEDHESRLLASVYTELRGNHGYAGLLAVDPDHQGLGLGQQMMQAAEARFRSHGCDAVEITVLSLRPELLPVYRRFGFVETGTGPFHDAHRLAPGLECHCIVMRKPL